MRETGERMFHHWRRFADVLCIYVAEPLDAGLDQDLGFREVYKSV
jgi:hypothetical protein